MTLNITDNLCTNIDMTGLEENGAKITMLNEESVSSLVETSEEYTLQQVHPETIQIGDFIYNARFVGKVEKIRVHETNGEKPCYCISTSYVTGDISMFRYFVSWVCNGCIRGNLAYHQGNERASWYKAELKA